MPKTIVIQSHRSPLPYPWLQTCLNSVKDWSQTQQFDYQFMADELFDFVPDVLVEKTLSQPVIATDLARLIALRNALLENYDCAIWMDADFLIFNPEKFVIPEHGYAVGREVWVQKNEQGKLKVYKKVHNAFLLFRRDNPFLGFYIDTAARLLEQNQGSKPPQFIGPKLLTALHNVAQLPVMEAAGMLSPLVLKDIINAGGEALNRFKADSPTPIYGANLCSSSCGNGDVSNDEMGRVIDILLTQGKLK